MPGVIEFPTIVQQATQQFGGFSPMNPNGGTLPNT